jgi:hypothetical protein
VIIRRALKTEKTHNNGNTKALLCNVLGILPYFCKILNSFKFINTFCQLVGLFCYLLFETSFYYYFVSTKMIE